ncbi:activator-dependent family glycosyltransferase [Amycolatopsis sp. YIM 10]|uniref:activator-dependent family glycosyltransferase n=1 Tax=Amycolatopsis sp. YIM 10 TaxID=2653857 RepID=UPI00128FEA3E|nr:activator-dependent family glycosyltransferase [Amycolatopsis sp. YIM 10]QFU89734.1 Desosaminyl transferase EryCIII precursor [Amycolatopsis sp. YIM 10]
MRVLFATYADKTHFLPMVPLAWALRSAGHDVRVATQPALVAAVTETGLPVVPVGRDSRLWSVLERRPELFAEATKGVPGAPYDAPVRSPGEVTMDYLVEGYTGAVRWWHRMLNDPMIDELVDFALAWRPDLIVWETNTYAGSIAAKVLGCAHGRLMWSIDYFGGTRNLFLNLREAGAGDEVTDPLATWLGSRLRPFGLDFSEDLVTGQFTVDHLPASLRMSTGQPVLPMRYIPYNGRASEPGWLAGPPSKPRVGLTLGVSGVHQFGDYPVDVQGLLDALAELDVEVVATVPDAERAKLRRIPGNVSVFPFVPLHALAPTCTAVIHHAGPGTICSVALSGIPHLALPDVYDEPFLAARLAEHGAGLAIPAAEATGPLVRDALRRLLTESSFRAGAARLREEILAMPTPNELVATLEELAAGRDAVATA